MRRFLIILVLTMAVTMPAQDKNDLPLPASGEVTLPLDEYNKLVDLAKKPVIKPENPPVPYAMKRADLKLRVTDDSVMGTIQCDGEIFAKGVTKVPLLNAPAVLDASQAGKALPLEQQGGMQTAILSGPAEFSIMLDAGIPLNIEAGRASFNLPVPAAGSAQLSLEIPGEHTNVSINPGLITSRSSSNGRTVIEATVVPGQTANIWWATREVAAPVIPREVRFLSNVKTVVSVSETDLRLTVLADITVIQGEPAQFEVKMPAGFELIGVTGASLESEEVKSGNLSLKINEAGKRNHQFLITMEKPMSASKAEAGSKAEVPLIGFNGAQRETGEVLVEAEGTIELTATEGGTLKRMDLKELNTYLRSLSRNPQHAAFRFHRQPSEPPSLTLAWTRFPDSSVLAAAAERAVITTVVTSEGRSLTEVKLVMKNQAQPFLKVGLPTGASILTADVAGEKVKPVQGADGSRVPLLRPGFRPAGSYTVEFVLMHAGVPFAKKGDSELSLPKMDVPISLLQWEVFLPERYKVKDFGGDALPISRLPIGYEIIPPLGNESGATELVEAGSSTGSVYNRAGSGQIGGYIMDASPAVLPGATVTATNIQTGYAKTTVASNTGMYMLQDLQPGIYRVTASMRGFQTVTKTGLKLGMGAQARLNFELVVAGVASEVEVTAMAENLILESASVEKERKKEAEIPARPASPNVLNLQRRVAGVLPISVEVPRAGNSYRFVRPLVLDEETKVTFQYKSK